MRLIAEVVVHCMCVVDEGLRLAAVLQMVSPSDCSAAASARRGSIVNSPSWPHSGHAGARDSSTPILGGSYWAIAASTQVDRLLAMSL